MKTASSHHEAAGRVACSACLADSQHFVNVCSYLFEIFALGPRSSDLMDVWARTASKARRILRTPNINPTFGAIQASCSLARYRLAA